MTMAGARGRLVVISGPSGVGKTTVLSRLLQVCPLPLVRSVSATTRAPRPGETDGVDYHFLSREEFRRLQDAGEFLECAEVYGQGDWYGTLARTVASGLEAGNWVVLGIDIQGAAAVVRKYPDALTIFLQPGSWDELESRLRGRQTESEKAVQQRLARARDELAQSQWYRFHVVNDDLDRTVREICDILVRHRGGELHD
jgi:guanylate kinase